MEEIKDNKEPNNDEVIKEGVDSTPPNKEPEGAGIVQHFIGSPRIRKNKKNLLHYLEEGVGITEYACSKVQITPRTFHNYYTKDEYFKEKVDLLRNILQPRVVEDKLLKLIDNGKTAAIVFYLKNRHPDYKPRIGIDGEIGVYNPYDKLTVEQLKERIRDITGKLGEEGGEELSELGK